MKLATFFVAATSTVKASWDEHNCVEVPKCDWPHESPWDVQCFKSTSNGFFHDGQYHYRTEIDYPLFALTNKFMTNSAVWIVMDDGADFDHRETALDNACGENQMSHCWTINRRGQYDYKFDRGLDWSQTELEHVRIGFVNKWDEDPGEAVAARMVICDADLHGFPIKPTPEPTTPEPTPEPEPLVCCDQMYQGNYPNWIHWQKTELTNAKNPVYQNDDGDFMWWMWHGDVGHWVINKTPGAHGNDVNKSALGPQKCPNEIRSSDWDVNPGHTTCLQCDKRLRPCEVWDDPATTDCYTWDVNYVGVSEWSENDINYDHKYRANLKYPFLEQTSYHNAQKSVWINFAQGGPSRNQVTPDPECAGETGGCWMRNQNGARFLQFTRGSNPNRPDYKLDSADIDMDIQMRAIPLGHEIPLDAVYLCNANQHSPPIHWDNVEPHAHLLPLPPASEPSVCSIDNLNEVTMNKDDLIAAGEKPGKAQRIVNFWNTQIINKFKTLYEKSQYSSCRYVRDFFCHEVAPPSSDYRDMYDWAQALFNERLGACGGYRQLDKKLQRWGKLVNIDDPVLESTDCPSVCHHSDFHKYLLPRIDYATENGGFTKTSHKNKFKYTYIKFMTIMQNEYRKSEECQESVGINDDIACQTVCLAKSPAELMGFYFARLGDSILRRPGCENAKYTPPRKSPLEKQMDGMNNWLSILDLSNADERSAGFWLPKWAADL